MTKDTLSSQAIDKSDGDFSIKAVLDEAWEMVHGSKWTFQLATGLYLLVYVGLILLFTWISMKFPKLGHAFAPDKGALANLLTVILTTPLGAGLSMLGVRRAAGAPIRAGMIFRHYNKTLQLFVASVVMGVVVTLGLLLLVIPGIYLYVGYLLSQQLIIDKNLSPMKALEASRKALGKRWIKIFGLLMILVLINIVAIVLTLGIGLIWTIPLTYISIGILYRIAFAGDKASPADETPQQVTQAF